MLKLNTFIVGQLKLLPASLRHIVILMFCLVCVSGGHGGNPPRKAFHVFTKREGDVTRFYVDNREANEVTGCSGQAGPRQARRAVRTG